MAKLVEQAYGDALLEASKEANTIDSLYEQVNLLTGLLNENEKLMDLLTHPDITVDEKQGVVDNILGDWALPELKGVIALLIVKERIGELPKILEYVTNRIKVIKGIGVVYVTSAAELSETQKQELMKKVLVTAGFKSLEMHYKIDKTIIGGLIIRIGDRVMDSSVSTRMDQLTRSLKTVQIS